MINTNTHNNIIIFHRKDDWLFIFAGTEAGSSKNHQSRPITTNALPIRDVFFFAEKGAMPGKEKNVPEGRSEVLRTESYGLLVFVDRCNTSIEAKNGVINYCETIIEA